MSASVKSYAAVDLGASSGRVMVGRVGPDSLELTEAHRFPNRPVRVPEGLRWDVLGLYGGVLDGLRAAGARCGGRLDSLGIDSWAVDYGLLDTDGALLGNPVHYRDSRTEGVAEKVWATVPAPELYAATGLQYAPFNTLYQLTAARSAGQLAHARRLLLIPDLLTYWLAGEQGTELTNASTTQLIDPRTREWSYDMASRLGIDLGLFAPLRQPGDPAGVLRPEVLEEVGCQRSGTGHHGRVARHRVRGRGRPGGRREVRVHLHRHLVPGRPGAGRAGADGGEPTGQLHQRVGAGRHGPVSAQHHGSVAAPGVRTGLGGDRSGSAAPRRGQGADAAVGGGRGGRGVPGAGPDAGADRRGLPYLGAAACPASPAEITRCILDSLALAHRRAVADAQRLADHPVDVVHIVGGGTRNALLCQLTADACGLPVVAGPTEAAALGNVLVQARAHGLVGDLAATRELLVRTQPLTRVRAAGRRGPVARGTGPARQGVTGSPPGSPPGLRFTHPMTDHKEPRCVSPCS
ncbi:Rhamnulokinase [Streptomyces alboniger]